MKLIGILIALVGLIGVSFSYNINLNSLSVTGFSGGGFFAMQFHFAFSKIVKGASIFSSGPYFCAQGELWKALAQCSKFDFVDLDKLIEVAKQNSEKRYIDDLENIKNSKVFIFAGAVDDLIIPKITQKAEHMYRFFGATVSTKYDIKAAHMFPTENYGKPCDKSANPAIGNCGYNGAWNSLSTVIGDLKEKTTAKPGNLYVFSMKKYQKEYITVGFHNWGYYYVPQSCKDGAPCKLHIVFHGCGNSIEDIGTKFIENAGFNEVAESNNLIILYPQMKKTIMNAMGCHDWWGFSDGPNSKNMYVTKYGNEMKGLMNIIDDLAKGII